MTRVIQSSLLGLERKRTLIAPFNLHQLASTCTKLHQLAEKKLRAELQAIGEQTALIFSFQSVHPDLPGANSSYRELPGAKKCENCLYPRLLSSAPSFWSYSVLFGAVWCSLVLKYIFDICTGLAPVRRVPKIKAGYAG